MPSLLDLPSELLFDIISLVDFAPYAPRSIQKRYRPAQLHSQAVVCFPTTDPSWPSHTSNILLVCKRLYHETSVYHSKAPRAFKMDVAVVKNHWIWPTWRLIPAMKMGAQLEHLDINLIHCRSEEDRASYTVDFLTYKHSLQFMSLIGNFLRHGTASASYEGTSMPKHQTNVHVKTITINVDTASIRAGNDKLSEAEVPYRHVQGLAHLTFDPLYSIDSATCVENIDRLPKFMNVAMSRAGDGLIISERVDEIIFSADGCARSKISMTVAEKDEPRFAEYRQIVST
jgi:hypothetical protein